MCARLRTTNNEGRSFTRIFSRRFTSPNHGNFPKSTHARREFPAPNRLEFASSPGRKISNSTRHSMTSRIAFNFFACNESAQVTRHLTRTPPKTRFAAEFPPRTRAKAGQRPSKFNTPATISSASTAAATRHPSAGTRRHPVPGARREFSAPSRPANALRPPRDCHQAQAAPGIFR
jgi:hypothetical protein